jgi:hypothetical protein
MEPFLVIVELASDMVGSPEFVLWATSTAVHRYRVKQKGVKIYG